MTIVVVQCRLHSTRLEKKALLPLDGKPLIAWTLQAMKKVDSKAHAIDEFWIACDDSSFAELSPIAQSCGWKCFAGPEHDVLERFCLLAEKTSADIILRATGDNPFLFYEAAAASLTEFTAQNCDYFTFTGIPHGSGVEVFSASAILKARTLTTDSYDHEHVGPALYNHREHFSTVFMPALPEWTTNTSGKSENYRTTIDTAADYRKASRIVRYLNAQGKIPPYASTDILSALSCPQVCKPILLVPSLREGRGTGHLRRCLSIAEQAKPLSFTADIFVQANPSDESRELIKTSIENKRLEKNQFLPDVPEQGEYSLIITDTFSIDKKLAQKLSTLAPLLAIDEGSPHTKYFDYLLNIIPPLNTGRNVNLFAPNFIPLPKNRRDSVNSIKKILISVGGEDPAGFTPLVLAALQKAFQKNIIDGSVHIDAPANGSVPNLKEKLHEYDLVITHYGFTAFEAAAAGCALILLATSPIHKKLAKTYGCVCLTLTQCTPKRLKSLCSTPEKLMNNYLHSVFTLKQAQDKNATKIICRGKPSPRSHTVALYPFLGCGLPRMANKTENFLRSQKWVRWGIKDDSPSAVALYPFLGAFFRFFCKNKVDFNAPITPPPDLQSFVANLSQSKGYTCPICAKSSQVNTVIARDNLKTIRRCKNCHMLYISFCRANDKEYAESYFFEDYKKQYGKTYLEDFESIKAHGLRRMKHIIKALPIKNATTAPQTKNTLLDIGCAFGPFLSAAKDSSWLPYGTDIAKEAISYVSDVLGFYATEAPFPNFNPLQAFGSDCPTTGTFDAVSMWYVIEHFQNLDAVLKSVANLVKTGGVFAFSTPNASGISRRCNAAKFFTQSPHDHFTIWESSLAKRILARYGFTVKKIVSTGHHSERFPSLLRKLPPRFLSGLSQVFYLGDTFEVYCIKKDI